MYIFGGNTGETPESLQRKREVAEALLRRGATAMPQNLPEGMVAVAQALSGRMGLNALDKKASESRAKSDASFDEWYKANMPAREISGTGGADSLEGSGGQDKFGPLPSDLEGTAAYIRQAAAARGIDPEIAVRVARSEGLAKGVWQSNYHKDGKRETSYGPYQLLVGGGLGDKFMKQTGLDPRDPSTINAQIDFALDEAKAGGWSPWYGAAKVGVGNWDGIRRGDNTLPGGEGEDRLMDGNPRALPSVQKAPPAYPRPDARNGGGATEGGGSRPYFSEVARPGPNGSIIVGTGAPDVPMADGSAAPSGIRPFDVNPLPPDRQMPSGPVRPTLAQAFAPPQAQPPLTPEGVTVPTMLGDEKPAPRPTPRPQPQMQPDPMQTAAVPPPAMQPRGIVSPRAEDNGYTRGPGAAPANLSPQQAVAGALMRRQAAAGAPPVGNAPASPAGGIPGVSPSTAAMLSDPNLSEGQRAMVLAVLKREMDAQDPNSQLDLEKKRLEVDALRNPKPEYSVLTDEEEKALGLDPAGSYQKGKDGKVDRIGGGGVNVTVGDNMKLTEGQSKDVGFYTRGIYANDELDTLDTQLTDVGGNIAGRTGAAGNWAKSPEYQQAERAGREFLAVILRKDSGAAITPDEMSTYGPMYLPQPGDSPEVIAGKKDARARAMGAIRLGLGTATPLADEVDKKFAIEREARKKKPANAGADAAPEGVDPEDWKVMTPEEKALWR